MKAMNKIYRYLAIITLGLSASACMTSGDNPNVKKVTSIDEQKILPAAPIPNPWLDEVAFGEEPKIITPAELTSLTDEQKQEFLDYYHAEKYQATKPSRRIGNFLERYLDNFNYYSDTFIAKDSLIKFQGNCLSLAILTKAYADLVEVNINYQLVESTPVFQQKSNVIISSQHVRTKLLDKIDKTNKHQIIIFPSHVLIDYFPTRGSRVLKVVDESEFYSMYYRNKAAESVIRKDYDLAYWLLRRSLDLKSTDTHAINMMAVVHYKKGFSKQAENIYLHGIKFADENLDLLSNYHSFLVDQDRFYDAEKIAYKVERYDNNNPFKWVSIANKAYNDKDFRSAISYYRKAVRLAPYLHETYAGIARAKFQLGEITSAKREMEKAIHNAYKKDTISLYQAKYKMLTQLVEE